MESINTIKQEMNIFDENKEIKTQELSPVQNSIVQSSGCKQLQPQILHTLSTILTDDENLDHQTMCSHSEIISLKKESINHFSDDMMSLTNEKHEMFSDASEFATNTTNNNNFNISSINNNINQSENTFSSNQNNLKKNNKRKLNDQCKEISKIQSNHKKNKRELRCKTMIIQQEKKSHAHRLDFDFLVFDSLKYAENKSPLTMAFYHKSIESFEMNRKDKLLTVHLDSLDKIKTPITLILKKLISDSHPSAKNLCDSLYYFHKLLKKFRMIRENNTDKINIFKQLMPILPNHQKPEQVLSSDPKYPSMTATYKINARKGTINLDKYTFNEKLANLLGFPSLELLQQNIQQTKKLPSLSVPTDYYNYIMECLLNKFEKSRNSVCKGQLTTFDGIKLNITEKIVSRCHIDSDITPEMLNVKKEVESSQSTNNNNSNKCKIEEEEDMRMEQQLKESLQERLKDLEQSQKMIELQESQILQNKNSEQKQKSNKKKKQLSDEQDEDDDDDDDSPQGILYVMTKHFFFVENQSINQYIFSPERMEICKSIDYTSLYQSSLPSSDIHTFNYVHQKQQQLQQNKKANPIINQKQEEEELQKQQQNSELNEKPKKKRQINQCPITDMPQQIKQECIVNTIQDDNVNKSNHINTFDPSNNFNHPLSINSNCSTNNNNIYSFPQNQSQIYNSINNMNNINNINSLNNINNLNSISNMNNTNMNNNLQIKTEDNFNDILNIFLQLTQNTIESLINPQQQLNTQNTNLNESLNQSKSTTSQIQSDITKLLIHQTSTTFPNTNIDINTQFR